MPLDIPLPTASPDSDPEQYIPLLLSAIEGFLLARDVWEDVDYPEARQYMEELKSYVVRCFGKCGTMTEVGTISMFGAEILPGGWLLCDGSEVLRAQYSELFGVIGETWGAGDGSTTFALPDFSDFSPMGVGAIAGAIGDNAGEQFHTLTTDEMPQHSHGITDPGHNHAPLSPSTSFLGNRPSGAGNLAAGSAYGTSLTTGNRVTGITVDNAGNSASHNNVHPVKSVPFMIFAGVTT